MQKNNQSTPQEQLLKEITAFLQESRIPYMVTGALSAIFYGRPRSSHDIDFVIEADDKDIERIKNAFITLPEEFLVQEDQIEEAILKKYEFNVLHLPTMLKLDFFLLKDNEFDKSRFQRRNNIIVFNQRMVFATAEDTILKKLLWYKESKIEKHLIDAAFVYQIQNENLDKEYLLKWVKKQKTLGLLREIKTIDLANYY